MFQTLKNAWRLPDIRKKILYVLLLVFIFRMGSFIPVPGVNPAYIAETVGNYSILSFLNLMTGGSFENFTVFALGISPYITASIIIQLLTIAIPALERMMKEGEEGRKKVERITRILGVTFAAVMSFGTIWGMGAGAVLPSNIIPNAVSYITIVLVCTSGSAFLMWLSERITEVGIGNGTSFIIFTGIVSRLPNGVISFVQQVLSGQTSFWLIPVVLVLVLVIITGVVFVDKGERRVPVQYSKKVVGRKMYGGQSTHIPMKVNSNGVLPLIFASTLLSLPGMIAQFWPTSGFSMWYQKWLSSGTVAYFLIYMLLIVGFSYFYTAITFNPIELSKNLQANGGFVPGIRPGRPTSDYLGRISNRLTLFSALFLAIIASVPTLFGNVLGGGMAGFGATSLLIMVSVALETNYQLESQVVMRHYKGFLK